MEPLKILGVGSALPDRVVTNAQLEEWTGFPASRMLELFEIQERRWARGLFEPDPPEGQRCSDLAAAAASVALERAGLSASAVGVLIAVSTTPDSLNPPFDSQIARRLGLAGTLAFSVQAPCTGLFRAVALARALLPQLERKVVLVVTADTPSPFFRFGPDVSTEHVLNSILYADGAGALVLGESQEDLPAISALGLALNTDPAEPGITFPAMLSSAPPTTGRYEKMDYLGHHDYRRVLRRGSKLAHAAAMDVLAELGAQVEDVRFFLTHQATGNLGRISEAYGLPTQKVPVNIARVGNTISASILLLLDELSQKGELRRGDVLVLHTAESSTWSRAGMGIRW